MERARTALAAPRVSTAILLLALTQAPGRLSGQDVRALNPPTRPACALSGSDLGGASGRPIRAIHVAAGGVAALPWLGAVPHVTTRATTIRDRLLMTAGDTVDTLRIAASERLLRGLRYISGAHIAVSCADSEGVVLTVTTRDAWSMQPRLSLGGSSGAVIGLDEVNVLGTGRAVRVYARGDRGQVGIGAGLIDPTLLHGRAEGALSYDVYRDGTAWRAALLSREASVFERWGGGIELRRATRVSHALAGDTLRRASAVIQLSRRLTFAPSGASYFTFGVEAERTEVTAGIDRLLAGPPRVRRTFGGVTTGASRRSAQYVNAQWLLPNAGADQARFAPAEVETGFRGDGAVAWGWDFATQRPMAHVDTWIGRTWGIGRRSVTATPSARALLIGDFWASGYRTLGAPRAEWSAGTLRGSMTFAAPVSHGRFLARVSAEHLVDPDPDARDRSPLDYGMRGAVRGGRLAETGVSATIERSTPLLGVKRGYALEAAVFAAGTLRWDLATPSTHAERLLGEAGGWDSPSRAEAGQWRLGVVGAGLHLTPARFGLATMRLDIGVPLRHSMYPIRPFVSLSISPSIGSRRRRDGQIR